MNTKHHVILSLILLSLAACEKAPSQQASAPAISAALPSSIFLTSAPADAKNVEEVKGTAKPGDTIAIKGRIGGSENPFVEGRAVFTLVGPGIPACSDAGDDHCKTPWDYCCETPEDIAAHAATVQIVDDKGALLRASVKGEHGMKELADLIVVGKVAQADDKLLIVNATGIYIAKQ